MTLPITNRKAFSLVEVLFALGVFFMVALAILEMMISSLRAARSLQTRHADAGMIASEFVATNTMLEEGVESGDFGDFYPNAHWERAATEVGTNGLYQVDFLVTEKPKNGKSEMVSTMSILVHRPGSAKGRMSGGMGRGTGLQPLQ